jgi:hypothetical protein
MSVDMKNVLNIVRMGGATLSGVTPANTSLVDMQGYESLTVLLTTGTVTDAGTASGFTLKLQHSDSTVAGTFVDCTANEVVPNAAGAITISVLNDTDDNLAIDTIGYRGNKRYVRAVVTGTTLTDAAFVAFGVRSANSSASAPVASVTLPTAAT